MISTIETFDVQDGEVYVRAVLEDMVLTHPQTMLDPPEYGAAICEAHFFLEEDEVLPEDENELIRYLENLDLTWRLIPSDDY